MRKTIKYIATALILVLAASCNKTDEILSGDALIRFAPQSIGTKATVDNATGLQNHAFAVVGLLKQPSATAFQSNFQNTISYVNGGWEYGTAAKYIWKPGTHKFFAYTNGAGTLGTDNKLTVSKVLTTSDEMTSDLLYSSPFASTADAWKAAHTALDSPVPLYFHHLFSAVSIAVKNCTSNAVTVKSVSAPAILNSGSATIDFTSADSTSVEYGAVSAGTPAFVTATPISDASIALGENEMIDVLKMAKVAAPDTAASYQVVWPQTLGEGDNAVKITVSYTMTVDGVSKDYENTVSLPADTWEANSKYEYILQILPTDVRLVFIVQEWEDVAVGAIDTEDGSINMSNVMWQNQKVKRTQDGTEENTLGSYYIYMYNKPWVKNNAGQFVQYTDGYLPAQAYFTVNYPLSGKFKIGLIQAAYWGDPVPEGVYAIYIWKPLFDDEGEPIMEGEGENQHQKYDWVLHDSENGDDLPENHDTIYFQVRATSPSLGTHPEYRAQVDIWIISDEEEAEWTSAYSEIRANYACVIPQNE